jgi:hypothetical protein
MKSVKDIDRRNDRAMDQLRGVMDRMDERAQTMMYELRMTAPLRRAAERAFARVKGARRSFFWPRHTATQRRFLRLMILMALAAEPTLVRKARRVARYYSRNYAFEWLSHPVSAPAREVARDAILRSGESQFGEAPLAGPLSYVMFHYEELGIQTLARYNELYMKASAMFRDGFFRDRGEHLRHKLGLPTFLEKVSLATPTPETRDVAEWKIESKRG